MYISIYMYICIYMYCFFYDFPMIFQSFLRFIGDFPWISEWIQQPTAVDFVGAAAGDGFGLRYHGNGSGRLSLRPSVMLQEVWVLCRYYWLIIQYDRHYYIYICIIYIYICICVCIYIYVCVYMYIYIYTQHADIYITRKGRIEIVPMWIIA